MTSGAATRTGSPDRFTSAAGTEPSRAKAVTRRDEIRALISEQLEQPRQRNVGRVRAGLRDDWPRMRMEAAKASRGLVAVSHLLVEQMHREDDLWCLGHMARALATFPGTEKVVAQFVSRLREGYTSEDPMVSAACAEALFTVPDFFLKRADRLQVDLDDPRNAPYAAVLFRTALDGTRDAEARLGNLLATLSVPSRASA